MREGVMDLTVQVDAVADALFKVLYSSGPKKFIDAGDKGISQLITIREQGRTWDIKLEWTSDGAIYAHFFHYKSGYVTIYDRRFSNANRHCICLQDLRNMAFEIIRDCNIAIYT